ncbi:hypothetical protein ABPG75_010936 [Micractinium tetrahymenae]
MAMPQVFHSKEDMRAWSRARRREGQTIGFVPTMGYLHDGHISLVKAAWCASLAAKVALLRAARAAGGDLRVAARLTRWQQQQRAAFKPQLEQLKAEGTTVRFWRGHILQRQAPDGGWVTVQRAASQAAE